MPNDADFKVPVSDVAARTGLGASVVEDVLVLIEWSIEHAVRTDAVFYCRLGPLSHDWDDPLAQQLLKWHERQIESSAIPSSALDGRDLVTRDELAPAFAAELGIDSAVVDEIWSAYFDLITESGTRVVWRIRREINERLFEEWLAENLSVLQTSGHDLEPFVDPESKLRFRQGILPDGKRYDLLCRDRSTGDIVVIENKVVLGSEPEFRQVAHYVEQLSAHPDLRGLRVRGLVLCDGTTHVFRSLAKSDPRIDWELLHRIPGYDEMITEVSLTEAELDEGVIELTFDPGVEGPR